VRRLRVPFVIFLLIAIHWVDARTGSAPFQHLYYIPIVFAAIAVPPHGGVIAAVAAVILYHIGNPRLLTFTYAEADIVQIALFLAIGIVTARLADDARRLRQVSEMDDLTGLYNLRGFERRLGDAVTAARRVDGPLAMLVLDVDRLKSLNDTHGHHTGADAVRLVGTVIAQCLPRGAFGCRFGGDEFVVSLPGFTSESARGVATAIREAVSGNAPMLAGAAFPERTLSVSIGVAGFMHAASAAANDVDAGEALFHAADEALYAAKAAGRNQVSVATLPPPSEHPVLKPVASAFRRK
jgi:diguanylate cyclase (GGDEF)-like protein